MLFSLILGIILGALTVIFALQNVAVITVSFLAWEITAPLAFVLLGTALSSVVITLLMLIPSLVRDDLYVRTLKKQKREIEDEFAKYRAAPQAVGSTQESRTIVEETHVIA